MNDDLHFFSEVSLAEVDVTINSNNEWWMPERQMSNDKFAAKKSHDWT